MVLLSLLLRKNDDVFLGVLGTSASCPVIAGILAHVNDYRLSSDLPPLGFVNPLIYQNADKFTDVTKGYNAGCDLGRIFITESS